MDDPCQPSKGGWLEFIFIIGFIVCTFLFGSTRTRVVVALLCLPVAVLMYLFGAGWILFFFPNIFLSSYLVDPVMRFFGLEEGMEKRENSTLTADQVPKPLNQRKLLPEKVNDKFSTKKQLELVPMEQPKPLGEIPKTVDPYVGENFETRLPLAARQHGDGLKIDVVTGPTGSEVSGGMAFLSPKPRLAKLGSLVTKQNFDEYGEDLIYYLERESHRVYADFISRCDDVIYLLSLPECDLDLEISIFSFETVGVVINVAAQYISDGELGFDAPFGENVPLEDDEEVFGDDFVGMVRKVILGLYVCSALVKHSELNNPVLESGSYFLPVGSLGKAVNKVIQNWKLEKSLNFRIGARVRHKKMGDLFGRGVVVNRNGNYLIAYFPCVGRNIELLTATALDYLEPAA